MRHALALATSLARSFAPSFATLLAPLLAGAALGLAAAPAVAQPHQKTLIIYGNDKCPQSNGEEIVVCEHRSENERYRIPKELRETEPEPGNGSAGARVATMDAVSQTQTGVDTCSPVGSGGQTGCFRAAARTNKAARRADAAADTPDK